MARNIEKAFSFFMMPFYIREGQIKDLQNNLNSSSVWKRLKMNIEKGILYSHIQDFLSKSVMEDKQMSKLPCDKDLASHDYLIYSLSQESERFRGMMDSGTEHAIIVKKTIEGETMSQILSFRFNNTDKDLPQFFSPKLIICPNAQVGLLLFSIEMTGEKNIENLSKLNYELFKTYKEDSSQTVRIYLLRQAKMLMAEAKELDNKQKERLLKGINFIDKAFDRMAPEEGYNIQELMDHHWTMRQLTESLMSDFTDKYVRADEFRLHVFTYLQVENETTQDTDLLSDFSRIIRCQDQDYLALPTIYGLNIYEQLFENVYVGCSVEGGGVLTILKGPGDDFMKSFDSGPLTHSYLWVYILVIMQRHTLLQMSRELAEEYGYAGEDLDSRLKHLRQVMRKMSKTKINTYFTDVSDHSHLNAFYSFCCRNLSVDRYFADVDSKLATLKETLEQLHNEQMEAYDKLQNNILKWVAVLALTLTLFSGLNDSYEYFKNFFDAESSPGSHAFIVICIIIAAGMVAWRIVEGIQNKHTNRKTK